VSVNLPSRYSLQVPFAHHEQRWIDFNQWLTDYQRKTHTRVQTLFHLVPYIFCH
jgi:hypothetical protein